MKIDVKYCLLIIYVALLMLGHIPVKAQCDEKLVDKAISKSGNEALFIREFALKPNFKGKRKKDKSLTFSSKYDIRLKTGIVYRFMVENEDNGLAKAILQLRKNNVVLANTYDIDNQYNIGTFDYLCNESGPYQVLISFVGENTGCAAGAMFAIVQDSLTLASIIDSSEIKNVLYIGMDNFVDIAASNILGGTLEVSISNGLITEDDGLYKIIVDKPGKIVINVVAKDKTGKITETFKSEFIAVEPILPTVTFARSTGGLIKKTDLINSMPLLEIHSYTGDLQFKIQSFEITDKIINQGIANINDNKLNFRQLNLIKDLKAGDTFYITNIEIEDSKGKTFKLNTLGFIISE